MKKFFKFIILLGLGIALLFGVIKLGIAYSEYKEQQEIVKRGEEEQKNIANQAAAKQIKN